MGTQDKSPNANNSMQRVKVYRLNEDGRWDDQGTGHVTVDYLERSEDLGLFVIDEEDNETLLLHRISSQDIYRKQEDTIISWRDPKFSTELALSFQEMTGCSYIWDHICSVQRNIQFSSLSNETYHNVNNELRELPPVELSTLPLILKTVVESGIADQLRVNELILHDQDFFRKLVDLFRICDDLENIDGLHMIFKLVRGIILLNSPQIFEKIFGDELIMDIIGCLEFDPEAPHVHHRCFLNEHAVFKEAIPIKDPLVLSKIHQTYRIGYLKDVILPRALDEATVASLNSIVHSNNATVVSLLKDDSTFIQELFATLKSPTTSVESKKTLVHFLHEFCTLSKSLQMVQQVRLFRDLVSEGIFDIIADVLQSEDKKLVLTGTEILILFLNQDPSILRSYVARQEGVLFGLLVKNMLTDFGDDMHCQFLEILRSLLDSYTSAPQVLYLTRRQEKYLVVAAVRFMRTLISRSDEHLMDHIVKNNLFKPILDAFVGNGDRYNLLNSAVLELFEHIRKENLKILLRYVVDSFWDQLVKLENLSSIQALKVKYEQSLESAGARSNASLLDQRKRTDERALEKEEEDYFNDSDEENSASVASSNRVQSQPVLANGSAPNYSSLRPSGLVDYEDDEDYKPPPKKLSDISEEDEGLAEFRLKRKLVSKEEPEPKRLMQSPKGIKPTEDVFAALCSTLSQAVLPSKKSTTGAGIDCPQLDANRNSIERNCNAKGSTTSSDDNRNTDTETHAKDEAASPRSFSDSLRDYPDNRQRVDDCALLSPKSSPEMAVNGS